MSKDNTKMTLNKLQVNKFNSKTKKDIQDCLVLGVASMSIEAAEGCRMKTYKSMLETVEQVIFKKHTQSNALKDLCYSFRINLHDIPSHVLSRCWKNGKIKYPVHLMCGEQYSILLKQGRLTPQKVTQSMVKKAIHLEDFTIKTTNNHLNKTTKGGK